MGTIESRLNGDDGSGDAADWKHWRAGTDGMGWVSPTYAEPLYFPVADQGLASARQALGRVVSSEFGLGFPVPTYVDGQGVGHMVMSVQSNN
jgi:hypothetical protein